MATVVVVKAKTEEEEDNGLRKKGRRKDDIIDLSIQWRSSLLFFSLTLFPFLRSKNDDDRWREGEGEGETDNGQQICNPLSVIQIRKKRCKIFLWITFNERRSCNDDHTDDHCTSPLSAQFAHLSSSSLTDYPCKQMSSDQIYEKAQSFSILQTGKTVGLQELNKNKIMSTDYDN